MSNWAIQLKLMKYTHLLDGVNNSTENGSLQNWKGENEVQGRKKDFEPGKSYPGQSWHGFLLWRPEKKNITVLNISASQHNGIVSTAMQERKKQHCFPVNSDKKGHLTLKNSLHPSVCALFCKLDQKIRWFPSTKELLSWGQNKQVSTKGQITQMQIWRTVYDFLYKQSLTPLFDGRCYSLYQKKNVRFQIWM